MQLLSVIVPALNEERFISETLRKLSEAAQRLQTSQKCPVQVIVVDHDSEDQTAEVARGFGATASSPFPAAERPILHSSQALQGSLLWVGISEKS